jgi:hypothetical protein
LWMETISSLCAKVDTASPFISSFPPSSLILFEAS